MPPEMLRTGSVFLSIYRWIRYPGHHLMVENPKNASDEIEEVLDRTFEPMKHDLRDRSPAHYQAVLRPNNWRDEPEER